MKDLPFSAEDILDNMGDGVYVCDRERRIVYWSRAAERITGWAPADVVGGDFYAIRQIDSDRFGFMLADMEGHGVAAALYTMHLSLLWERCSELLRNPAVFATAVNDELARVFEKDVTFATAICGVVDAAEGTLSVSAAGGPPALIIHPDRTIDQVTSSGLPLGCMDGGVYLEARVQLRPGDSILVFSDGAFEIHDAADRQLGVDGILEILKKLDYPQTPLSLAVFEEELLRFSNEIRLQDDVTIIEMCFQGRG